MCFSELAKAVYLVEQLARRNGVKMKKIVGVFFLLGAMLVQADVTVTNSAVADTLIDQHVNRANTNYGTDTSARVGRLGDAYTNPIPGPQTWMLISWDLSNFSPVDTISNVTLRIQQTDGAVETTDIYAVDSGSWNELEVTWSSYATNSTDSYVGNMTNQPISSGVTTFSDVDLTELVQAWVDGSQENLGIVLKYPGEPASGTTAVGDTFATRENTNDLISAQLVINYEPGPELSTMTNSAIADTLIDQHVDRANKNYGTNTSARVGRLGDAYTNPVEGPQTWMLINWDLSSLGSGAVIADVTLRIQQTDGAVETTDIYAVDSGSWSEQEVTWSSYATNSTDSYIGNMVNQPISSGVTTFHDADLTALVQAWVDGSKEDLGLVLKYPGEPASGTTAVGDTFATRENTGGFISAELVIDYVPGLEITTRTNSAVADTLIDQHVNRANTNYGTDTSARVGRLGDAYTTPVVGPQTWMLISWDLSDIDPSATIEDVTFNIQQVDSGVETTDIYAVDTGSWTEMGVTWSSYETNSTDSYIGNMVNQPLAGGITTFSDADLTALVQAWVDGGHENLGIVLKYPGDPASGTTAVGDTFMTRENTQGYIAPELVISYAAPASVPVPEAATLTITYGEGAIIIGSTNLTAAAQNQLQGKLSLSDLIWSDLGAPVTGVSETNWIVAVSNSASFYRVESSN
jgi:hypothetical protein